MNFYRGTGVALVTPFNEKGEIDEISLRQLVREVIQGGVDYLVALGTTSEAADFDRGGTSAGIDNYFRRKPRAFTRNGWNRRKQYGRSAEKYSEFSLCERVLCGIERDTLLQ